MQKNPIFIKIMSYENLNGALDQLGHLYTWGINIHNCLGFENISHLNDPTILNYSLNEDKNNNKIIDFAIGHNFIVAILAPKIEKIHLKNAQILNILNLKEISENNKKRKIKDLFIDEEADNFKKKIDYQKELNEIFKSSDYYLNLYNSIDNNKSDNLLNKISTINEIPNVKNKIIEG